MEMYALNNPTRFSLFPVHQHFPHCIVLEEEVYQIKLNFLILLRLSIQHCHTEIGYKTSKKNYSSQLES